MMTVAFTLSSCIHGYHVYKDVWDPPVGEIVVANVKRDLYTIALQKDSVTVGHVPRVISCVCTLLLRHGGIIKSTVTGLRRHSDDIPEGGLEFPCTYQFKILQRRLVNCCFMNRMESVSCKVCS